MPIRLNLLAEAQAVARLERRNPVKRAAMAGALLVSVVLVWSSSLQLKTMMANSELSRVQAQVRASADKYRLVLDNQRRINELQDRVSALTQLATNRFLNATFLNALQQATLNDVELTRLKIEQKYTVTEGVKGTTNASRQVVGGRPSTIAESIVVTLGARDSGPDPGDAVQRFKRTINENDYFQSILGKTNEFKLLTLSPPQQGPNNVPFVAFTLEGRLPEKIR